MEYCQGCGARRDGDSRYCLQCGRQFPGEVQRKPDTGIAKYLGRVGPLALLFFFLPWVTVSCQMGGASQSFSGWDLAKGFSVMGQAFPGQPILYLIPLIALVLGGIALLAEGRSIAAEPPFSVFFQVTIPIVPLLLMAIKYQTWNSEIQEGGRGLMTLSMNAGFMLTGLAFIASVAGGVLVLAAPRTPQAISPPIVATTVDPVPAPTSPHDLPNDSQAYCPRCGTHNTEPGQFCTECGCAFK